MSTLKETLGKLKAKGQTLWEVVMFLAMSGIATVVDLAGFALFNFVIFAGLKDTAVSWWLFDYSVENGGLCALLSLACSFTITQIVNFFLQRKVTFGATSNVAYSAVMYAIMVIGVYFLILWLPTLYTEAVCLWLGASLGAVVVKLSTQFISAVIQFPINKWVIMRNDKPKAEQAQAE